MIRSKISACVVSVLLTTGLSCTSEPESTPIAPAAGCALSDPVETGGLRRLALIVGVGQYLQDGIPDLEGPPQDAIRFHQLLTAPEGYAFPQENVCLLLNEQATVAGFREAFQKVLVDRARPQDVAVFYYAGHGSQARDRNGDEPDELDETLVLHDSRTPGVRDMLDDELNTLLAQLAQKTRNLAVFMDSCNSGTATRGEAGTYLARFLPPDQDQPPDDSGFRGDAGSEWAPQELEGSVFFSAAGDGTPALETGGRGVFTDALLEVFSEAGSLTYAQAARRVPSLVKARSYQIPYFQGDLDRTVFGAGERPRPLAWEVTSVGPPLQLSGAPLPGLGRGAELRIYDGAVTGADTRDPARSKATVVMDEFTGVNGSARISARRPDAPALREGDLAVPVRPGDDFLRLRVRLRPASESGGLTEARAARLRDAISADPEARQLVELSPQRGDFEFCLDRNGRLQLLGPENRVRITFEQENEVRRAVENLWQHARQRALLSLQGEGGSEYRDNETLQARLVEAAQQSPCSRGGWVQAEFNQEQVVPLCHSWNLQVRLSPTAPTTLLIGGVILSSDGSTIGFPRGGQIIRLGPGQSHTFRDWKGTATTPLDVQDQILVFGTQETNPVRWDLLTTTAATRSAAGDLRSGTLYRALDAYLRPGMRGQTVTSEVEDTTWTVSRLPLRVEANARFLAPDSPAGQPRKREYTIHDFDLRPYLPDDPNTALYKVLQRADYLARYGGTDGVPYKQHDWSRPSDTANLALGIDCSRSIWFAFTRAGLPYNRADSYLHTAIMVGDSSRMDDNFDRCDNDSRLRIGDVLVYRDENRQVGHTVMVIDPDKRIAWGSHGWDGNVREGLESDRGVEYQLIKYKADWERWDRTDMKRKACWRYRQFSEEFARPGGSPGVSALEDACRPDRCNR